MNRLIYLGVAVVLFVAIIVFAFPNQGQFKYTFYAGKPWLHEELTAPFDFPILKSADELKVEREAIVEDKTLYFRYDSTKLLNNYKSQIKNELNNAELIRIGTIIIDSINRRGLAGEEWLNGNKKLIINFRELNANRILTLKTVEDAIKDYELQITGRHNPTLVMNLLKSLELNILYDKPTTDKVIEDELNKVSVSRGLVQKGERVISSGEIVTKDKYQVLTSLKNYYEDSTSNEHKFVYITLGHTIVITLLLVVFVIFIYFIRPQLMYDNKRLMLIGVISLISILIQTFIIENYPVLTWLNPLLIAPIIIKAFTDSRIAFIVHFTVIMMLGLIAPDGFNFVLIQLITGYATILVYYSLQKRSQFLVISLIAFFAYTLTTLGLFLIQSTSIMDFPYHILLLFAINGLLIMLSYPLIFVFEKIFGITTDMTFLELSDINNPLLKEMSRIAPGTFQHSVMVSNIAEELINEIGGNPLLVRAGAMYHDIGKMDNAYLFTENQYGAANPHDNMSPEDSAKIIIEHVGNGVQLAKKNHLPEEIIDLIRTHHGTKRTEFFYRQAVKELGEDNVNKSEYTYRGPVPTTREQCVLMISDTVEAASKSLKQPDENSINDLVERLITEMLNSGQFSKSDLRLNDISTIKKVLKSKLASIYHLRIAYPA